MKAHDFRTIGSIFLSILLITSLFVFVNNGAQAEPSPTALTSSSSDSVSAASGSNRFLVWVDQTPWNKEIFFRRSTDSGATWNVIVNLSNNPGRSVDPQIAVFGSNVYVAWLQYDSEGQLPNIYLLQSADNGATWEPRVKISNTGGAEGFPRLAVSGSKVYVAWEEDSGSKTSIMLRHSADDGASWKSAVKLTEENTGVGFFFEIAASGSNVYVVWCPFTDSDLGDILFRRSTDNGATWKAAENLSDTGKASQPQLAVSGSKVYVVWSDGFDEEQDIMFRRSTDNGATWKTVKNLSNDLAESFSPKIAVSGSNVYVAWAGDPPDSNRNDVLLRRSTDSGVTWKSVKDINDSRGAGGSGIELAASGSNVYVVWQDNQILLRRSTDNGASWIAIKDLSNSLEEPIAPQLAVSGSNVYVVWADNAPGNYDILFRRSTDNGAAWKSVKNISNNDGDSFVPQIAV
jgi:Neuraminidase (sialidase)